MQKHALYLGKAVNACHVYAFAAKCQVMFWVYGTYGQESVAVFWDGYGV
jgi:hypothetical protein